MAGTLTLKFVAANLEEATNHALVRWREITQSEEARLPWSTDFDLKQDEHVDDQLGVNQLRVKVTIQLDDKALGLDVKI